MLTLLPPGPPRAHAHADSRNSVSMSCMHWRAVRMSRRDAHLATPPAAGPAPVRMHAGSALFLDYRQALFQSTLSEPHTQRECPLVSFTTAYVSGPARPAGGCCSHTRARICVRMADYWLFTGQILLSIVQILFVVRTFYCVFICSNKCMTRPHVFESRYRNSIRLLQNYKHVS